MKLRGALSVPHTTQGPGSGPVGVRSSRGQGQVALQENGGRGAPGLLIRFFFSGFFWNFEFPEETTLFV